MHGTKPNAMSNPKNLKIFCVDDELFTLQLSQQILKNLEYHDVHVFQNGFDCLTHISENPDLVFLDYNMEGMNGIEVLKAIKKYNSSIYVVLLSADEDKNLSVEGVGSGAFTFMKKEGNLQDTLSSILERLAPRLSSIRSFLSTTGVGNKPNNFSRVKSKDSE